MSSRFVNPFTDLGFKIIFGQPASKDLLIILLNELLSGEHHIEDLTFLPYLYGRVHHSGDAESLA